MTAFPRLQRISASDLDSMIADLKERESKTLVLCGHEGNLSSSSGNWPEIWHKSSVVYLLKEHVPDLAHRISKLRQLTCLDLSCNWIGPDGASSLACLSNLTSLRLEHNNIGDEGAKSISVLQRLTCLNLCGNKIGDGGAASLSTLTQLTSLCLAHNNLGDEGVASLAHLSRLQVLNLWGNRVSPEGVRHLAVLINLKQLNMKGNMIGDKGAASVASCSHLVSLNLEANDIGESGATCIAALSKLTTLNLYGNKIGNGGAASLAALAQLKCLDLGFNNVGIEGIASLAGLLNLEYLYLKGNKIGDRGAEILSALSQLTSLDLEDNQISDLGISSLTKLIKLKSLNLRNNKIGASGAAYLVSFSKITSLNLWGNKIGDEGAKYLSELVELTSLDLGNNNISAKGAASLVRLSRLKHLNMWGNEIGALGAASLAALRHLKTLDLEMNNIGDAGLASLTKIARITSLNLACNQICDAEPLSRLRDLKYLSIVAGNPLTKQPPEIIKDGDEAILNYLIGISQQGVDYLYEAKVLILGEPLVGKTSLLRRLYCPDLPLPERDEDTRGIDILRHQFTDPEGRLFNLNVWDFGGQHIYQATHQFFLTKRSLYILVDNTRQNCKTVHDLGFKYWLEVIEALSEHSPVLIFQNEVANRSKKIDEAGIKGRFPNVIDVYRGNLDQPHAEKSLEWAIRLKVLQLPHIGDRVPAKWLDIRRDLEEEKKARPFISLQEYFAIYERHLGSSQTEALRLSRYFHDLGIFLHFQDDPLLSRTVILQNNWATDAVFKIFDDEPTKAQRGYFDRGSCERIWANSIYADMHLELLTLMVKFELCYQLPDQQNDAWLMPQLLAPSVPEVFKDWAEADDLVLTYKYAFLPKGIVNRLMVRMHRFVRDPNYSWESGAFFEKESTMLLVRISIDCGQEIELRARGSDSKSLMSIISSDLDALNDSFQGLRDKVRKLVPCRCDQCMTSTTPFRFDEPTLLRAKHQNILSLRCNYSFQEVNVSRLLDGLDFTPPRIQIGTKVLNRFGNLFEARNLNHELFDANTKLIRIFLASSSELKEDRESFELCLRQENDRLRKKGFYLEITGWENFLDAMSETRLQDEYNKKIQNCDIFVSLFKTRTGKYTEEEFDTAHASFKATGKPLIYTYFMRTEVPNDRRMRGALNSLWDFQDRLSDLGHLHTEYFSIHDLQNQFRRQLDKIIDEKLI